MNEHSEERLRIYRESNEVQLTKYEPSLQYLIISTEPGRKIIYPPVKRENFIRFSFESCSGISIDREGYCCLGLDSSMTKIKESVEKKLEAVCVQKIIYISKISIHIKLQIPEFNTKVTKHLSTEVSQSGILEDKYNFQTIVEPPQDLTAEEIQLFLEMSVNEYGTVSKVDVKRNCLMISFENNVEIKKSFVVKGIEKLENGDLILTYWAITSHRTLFTFEPSKLIQLPIETKVKELLIVSEWAIISTDKYVLFLHLYRPSENFLSLPDLQIHAMQILDSDRVILFEYKYLHVYHLFTHKNPVFLGRVKTKKLMPHTVAFRKKTALFGGINYSQMFNGPIKDREIIVIENFTTGNMMNKELHPDKTLCICKKNENTPVTNLVYLEATDLFACACGESVYLFHLDSSSLIASVDLPSTVIKLFEISYPINFVNCLVKTENEKNLIRVSFEQNGQIIGTEITCEERYGEPKSFVVEGKDVYCTEGEMVLLYGESHKSKVLFYAESEEEVEKICVLHEFLSFLAKKKGSLEIYFIEL